MRRSTKYEARNTKILPIILIGIAIVLGYAIYNQHNGKLQSSPSPSSQPKLLPSNLTDDEKFILHPPSSDASTSAKQMHAQIVAKLAKVGDALEIKDCKSTPLVLQVKQGSEFKIKNSDKADITVLFDEDHQYKISATSSKTIKAEFKYGTGDYGYVCQGVGLVGFLHIVP